jgi:hypothetical protein
MPVFQVGRETSPRRRRLVFSVRTRSARQDKECLMLDKAVTNHGIPPKDPEALTTDEVRGGETGHGVRYMLVVSLTAALIALAVAWVYVA